MPALSQHSPRGTFQSVVASSQKNLFTNTQFFVLYMFTFPIRAHWILFFFSSFSFLCQRNVIYFRFLWAIPPTLLSPHSSKMNVTAYFLFQKDKKRCKVVANVCETDGVFFPGEWCCRFAGLHM